VYTAATAVKIVAPYMNYGGKHDDPCISCSHGHEGMTHIQVGSRCAVCSLICLAHSAEASRSIVDALVRNGVIRLSANLHARSPTMSPYWGAGISSRGPTTVNKCNALHATVIIGW
jgi:hypothetical protein